MALEELPRGSNALDQAYEEAMGRIQTQQTGFQNLAIRVLVWVTCARRPLTTLELQHALAVEDGESSLDRECFEDVQTMVTVCAGLITVDEESHIICLVHYTTQEYLERTLERWFPNAQDYITVQCISYLSLYVFSSGECQTDEEFETRENEYPFIGYTANNWGYHACGVSPENEDIILRFLMDDGALGSCDQSFQIPRYRNSGYSQGLRKRTAMHLLAYFGLTHLAETLIRKGFDWDTRDNSGQTPLFQAVEQGHIEFARLLLKEGVDLNAQDEFGLDPLSYAAKTGSVPLVKLLLDRGADVNSRGIRGWTPLSWAIQSRHEEVVRLLLHKYGAEAVFIDAYYRTPLIYAILNTNTAMAKLLLDHGVDADSKDRYDRTPLFYAAAMGLEEMVVLLLDQYGVESDNKDLRGRTPLFWAVSNRREAVVKLLLSKNDVDPAAKTISNRTPLMMAVINGQSTIVKLIVERYAKSSITVPPDYMEIPKDYTEWEELSVHCDICFSKVLSSESHYHCEICDSDNFDICLGCFNRGSCCLDPSHELTKRVRQHGKWIELLNKV